MDRITDYEDREIHRKQTGSSQLEKSEVNALKCANIDDKDMRAIVDTKFNQAVLYSQIKHFDMDD